MSNGVEGGFKFEKTKNFPEGKIEATRKHLDSIKNPLLSELPKGKAKEFLSEFFEKAEIQIEKGGGDELDAILNLHGEKEWEAERNLKTFLGIKDFFENPPKQKQMPETKTGSKKTEVDPEIIINLKFIQAILQQNRDIASSGKKILEGKSEKK